MPALGRVVHMKRLLTAPVIVVQIGSTFKHMKKPVLLFLSFLIGISPELSYAQDGLDREPPKWGLIPREHLKMDHYAPDSSAAAVILADYGKVFFERDGDMVFERYTRIKILTEAGYDWGNVAIPYLAERRRQRVKDIEGCTYYAAEGGRVETQEMKQESVFDEDVDGVWKRIRFTLPALRPGSVIEYRYKVVSKNPMLFPAWGFQESEPVLWSEFRADIPGILEHVWVYQGRLKPDVEEQTPYTYSGSSRVRGIKYRWVMQEVPALRREPYMTTLEDFRAKIRFEFAGTSWDQLAEELMGSKRFGKQIDAHRRVRDQARAVVEGLADPKKRMQALYDYLRTTMVWSGRRGMFIEHDLDDALTARSGDSPEVALLLVSMLREAGLEAHPVLISTRSHGRVSPAFPLLFQFNDVLAFVEIDGVRYFLDATDPLRPYTLLPEEALAGEGFLVRHPNPIWVAIKPAEQYRHQRFLKAELNADGQLTGTIEASDGGYSALAHRRALEEARTPEAFVQEALLDGLEGAVVDSCTVSNEEAVSEELKTVATFTAPAYAQVAGDFLYFNPTPLGRLGENPLRSPERTFPVDLSYPRQLIYNVALKLPERYVMQETPRNVRIALPGDEGFYRRLTELRGDLLLAQSEVVIKQTVFEPERYEQLRSFFEEIVAAEAEQVVLKRVSELEKEMDGGVER
jgi:transglutaminase-like putative cysteine protease